MNIVVLGAGTAGLVTALMIREKYPLSKINIIKSGEIGIIGVGEGSTEHWAQFMDYVGIDVVDLIYETKATVKIGILFKDWNHNSEYVHNVGAYSQSSLNRPELFNHLYLLNNDKFPLSPGFNEIYYKNYVQHTNNLRCSNQYHFDTFKLNEYLMKKCLERDMIVIDTIVTEVLQAPDGDITHLRTEHSNIPGDIFIDCSGFKRVISSKLGVEWESKSKYLPMNRAIAFPTELDDPNNIEPYTTSTALSAGWSWKIPTQDRYGNGYVFNSDYISADQALSEMNLVLNLNVEKAARDIKFDAGKVNKFWVRNVISVGLSSSFAEPLEAQSIGFTIIQAGSLINYLDTWAFNKEISDQYNEDMDKVFNNIIDYLQLHYFGNRTDTKFWQDKPFVLTDFIKNNIEQFKSGIIDPILFKDNFMFKTANFYQVLAGLDLINKNSLKESLSKNRDQYNQNNYSAAISIINKTATQLVIKHSEYLKQVNDNYIYRRSLSES
jgi:flavin-dependent dehydrogenase